MARKTKYTGLIITKTVVYIDNNTCEPCTPSYNERMIDGMNGNEKFSFCELFTNLGTITANTLNALDAAAWEWATKNNHHDIFVHIVK